MARGRTSLFVCTIGKTYYDVAFGKDFREKSR